MKDTVTFYSHSALAAALGTDPATKALDAFWWLRASWGKEQLPDWADAHEANRQARYTLQYVRWLQKRHPKAYLLQPDFKRVRRPF